jgi:hypothetical protein
MAWARSTNTVLAMVDSWLDHPPSQGGTQHPYYEINAQIRSKLAAYTMLLQLKKIKPCEVFLKKINFLIFFF